MGFEHSQDALHRFSDSQWRELTDAWTAQSLEWQDRLVYILGDDSEPRELDLLIDMYVRGKRDITLSAAEALRGATFEGVRAAVARRAADREDELRAITVCVSINVLLRYLDASR